MKMRSNFSDFLKFKSPKINKIEVEKIKVKQAN